MAAHFPNTLAAAQEIANREAARRAQKIRNDAVIACPVLKKPIRVAGAIYSGGRLRQSITVQKLADDHYRVGTNVEYALYVEFGTRRMAAQPFLRPALEKNRG